MGLLLLGNPNPHGLGAESVTIVNVSPDETDDETFRSITHVPTTPDSPEMGLWMHHGKDSPSWVHSPDHPDLAARIAAHYGCEHKIDPDDATSLRAV